MAALLFDSVSVSPGHIRNGAAGELNILTLEDVVRLADPHLLITHLGGHDVSGRGGGGHREQQRHVFRIRDPVPVGIHHLIVHFFHRLDLAAHQSAGSHQRRGQVLEAVIVQLRSYALHLHLIGDLGLRLFGVDAVAVPA